MKNVHQAQKQQRAHGRPSLQEGVSAQRMDEAGAEVAPVAWAVLPKSRVSSRIQRTCSISPVKPERKNNKNTATRHARGLLLIRRILRSGQTEV